MPQRVSDFFAVVAQGLISGRLEETLALHRFPFPLHIEDEQHVMWREADLRGFLLDRRSRLLGRGVVRVAAQVAGIEVPRNGRFRAWVRWLYFTSSRMTEEDSASIFYLRREASGRIEAEMCHFLSLATLGSQEARTAGL